MTANLATENIVWQRTMLPLFPKGHNFWLAYGLYLRNKNEKQCIIAL